MSGVDVAARGLAASAKAGLATSVALGRITRIMSRASARNPIDLAEGGSALATVTPKAIASRTSGLTQAINQASKPALFRWHGGVATYNAATTGWRAPVVSQRTGGNFTATQNALSQRFSFMTDAASADVVTFVSRYRVLVNGQYVGKAVRSDGLTAGGYNILNIATTDTSRQLRRFDIELVGGDANIGGTPSNSVPSLYLGPNDTLVPIDTSDCLRIAVIGDSFSSSTGASWNHLGWAVQLGYLLGGIEADVRQIAIGGTGYVNDATSPGPRQYSFIQHIGDLAQADFDIVIFAGGINDSLMAGAQSAALSTFQAARALQPDALFVVMGAWCGAGGATAALLATEAAIQAATVQWGDALTVFVPVSGDPVGAWIGTSNAPVINASGAAGGGNPDGTHPGDVGHLYLARRANAAIRSALRSRFD